jgi:colanic acid biosynthesis protein WcaH
MNKMLTEDEFIMVVKNTPLVAIDLVIRSKDNEVLMGMRLNEPAAGYWFVPGGRIRKNESIEDAFLRITKAELGMPYAIEHSRLLGAFTHKYQSNFAHVPGVSTHYVVLAYELLADVDLEQLPLDQHSKYRWVSKNSDPTTVHPNAEAYFSYFEPAFAR